MTRPRAFRSPGMLLCSALISAVIPLAAGHAAAVSWQHRGSSLGTSPRIVQCYDSVSQPTGHGVSSQNFESSFASLDDAAATDVTIDNRCNVGKIIAHGFYVDGSGPVQRVDVTFFTNAGGAPGTVLKNGYQPNLGVVDNQGVFTILLNHKVKLEDGTFWVSVVADMSLTTGGYWAWSDDLYDTKFVGIWENPAGGWGSGCVTWASMQGCRQDAPGRSLEIELWRTL